MSSLASNMPNAPLIKKIWSLNVLITT